ncbi:MAG TPA: multicopper oxidase domain-containing protein [Candidatus Eisenbacteria bacterium]|nr:multicopper oxidase domain-containing protein [Candidatus Eisenbacteria bacterium]
MRLHPCIKPVLRWSGVALTAAIILVLGASAGAQSVLDPLSLAKYVDPLPIPAAIDATMPGSSFEIGAYQIQQKLHRDLPLTTVYGYGLTEATATYPGPTIVARHNVPIQIRWTNHLPMTHILDYAIDPTLMRAETSTGVPITTHVHGAEVEPQSDGGPNTWFTKDFAETGPDFTSQVHTYVNTQLASTIWYHDHAFGYTRHNVYAGLAGYYLITDPGNEPPGLPEAPYDMGLAIQDRMFTTDGQLWYPNEGVTSVHPKWIPEFFGNVILVNGKVWPYLNVEPRKYRFRMLNGSQARFYSLALLERVGSTPGPAFYQIGTDGGYLAEPVLLNDPANVHSPRLVIAPGERADVVIDFSAYAPGTEFLLRNTAKAPYPMGDAPDGQTTGQIMLFRVVPSTGPDNSVIPPALATVNRLTNPTVTRTMTLNERLLGDDPLGALLNGMPYDAPATEYPVLGTTEMWEIANLTGDTHPIHLHLVQFQLLNRQKLNARRYQMAFDAANPTLPSQTYVPVPVGPYLKGKPTPADANERGWKDTFRMNPGEVTRVLVRWAPQDESPSFAFDATADPGYVWHCHILEHEENDMMRPFHVVAPGAATAGGASVNAAPAFAPASLPGGTVAFRASNPALEGSNLRFSLTRAGSVALDLFSVAGRHVATLASGWYEAGDHDVSWTARATSGEPLANGVYVVRFRGDGVERAQKMVLVR